MRAELICLRCAFLFSGAAGHKLLQRTAARVRGVRAVGGGGAGVQGHARRASAAHPSDVQPPDGRLRVHWELAPRRALSCGDEGEQRRVHER